jgi:light-regulated signal transduction histidine kinase (bacteriophytochrome)
VLVEDLLKGEANPRVKEYLGHAVDASARMRHLIDALLSYSKVRTQAAQMRTIECDVVLAEALDNLKVAIAESRATVTSDRLPSLHVDPVQFSQVFQNLVGNAIKYQAGDVPRIHISSRREGSQWIFSVQDNGIGIESGHADKVFQMFRRLHPQHRYSGAGVGLAICKHIVEGHGGRIWVESSAGRGSVFYFSIPA